MNLNNSDPFVLSTELPTEIQMLIREHLPIDDRSYLRAVNRYHRSLDPRFINDRQKETQRQAKQAAQRLIDTGDWLYKTPRNATMKEIFSQPWSPIFAKTFLPTFYEAFYKVFLEMTKKFMRHPNSTEEFLSKRAKNMMHTKMKTWFQTYHEEGMPRQFWANFQLFINYIMKRIGDLGSQPKNFTDMAREQGMSQTEINGLPPPSYTLEEITQVGGRRRTIKKRTNRRRTTKKRTSRRRTTKKRTSRRRTTKKNTSRFN